MTISATEVVQRDPHLPDVHHVESEMMEVGSALVDQRHHMVLGAEVQPHPVLSEPIGHAHPEPVAVEAQLLHILEERDIGSQSGQSAEQQGVIALQCIRVLAGLTGAERTVGEIAPVIEAAIQKALQ